MIWRVMVGEKIQMFVNKNGVGLSVWCVLNQLSSDCQGSQVGFRLLTWRAQKGLPPLRPPTHQYMRSRVCARGRAGLQVRCWGEQARAGPPQHLDTTYIYSKELI